MKKIYVFILAIMFLTLATISATALGKPKEDSSIKVKNSIDDEVNNVVSEISVDISYLNTQKEVIFNNLLNCIDYYDTVKGSFETSLIGEASVKVEYEVDIPKQVSFEAVRGSNIDLEIYSQDGTVFEFNKITKKYNAERFIPQYDERTRKKQTANIYEKVDLQPYYDYEHKDISSQRTRKNTFGENEYFYRYDLTNTAYAANSIYPQNLVFGFMSDVEYWDITAVEQYSERQVFVVSGKTSDQDYAQKLQVYTFEMRFDLKTGILLDFKGFSSNGDVKQYLKTADFSVDVADIDFKEHISDKMTHIIDEYTELQ